MAPTLIASYYAHSDSQTTNTLVSPSFTPAVGEVIVVKATTEGDYNTIGSISGGTGVVWTQRIAVTTGGADPGKLWTTTIATAPGPMTVSVTFGGSNGQHSIVIERWQGRLATTPAVGSVVGASTGAANITTVGIDSVITWCDSDYDHHTSGSTTAYIASTLVATQLLSNISAWYAYSPAPTPGTYTMGISSPLTQKGTTFGIEILTGAQTLTATGKAYGSIGHAVVTHADITIAPSGHPYGAIGHATVTTGDVTLSATGVPSKTVIGNSAILTGIILQHHGVASAFVTGASEVDPGPVTLSPTGVPSRFATGFSIAKRIQVVIASALITKPADVVEYELLCVNRVPQQSGPPTFVEVDALEWTGLSYNQALNRPDDISVGVSVTSLPQSIKNILKDQAHKASEIWLYRNGTLIFSGPWLGWQVQNQTLSITSQSLAAYLGWMVVLDDMSFAQIDQFSIAKSLIDQWQSTAFANFGIDTSAIGLSGVLRDANYKQMELDLVDKCVDNLSKMINGFDWSIDPSNRELKLYYPQRGVDRSTGPDAIIFDEHNVQNTNIICSSGPKDIASDAFGTGTGNTQGIIYSTKFDPDLRQHFGRSAIVQNFDGVSDQGTLDNYTQALVTSHGNSLLIPGPDARVTVDEDLNKYSVGDTVSYELHSDLGVVGAFRLLSRRVVVAKTGKETVTVAFV